MQEFITIANSMYEWVVSILFGDITTNEWYTSNLDAIRGITTVVLCAVVVLFALWLVVAVWRFLASIFTAFVR